MLTSREALHETGLAGLALKPAECDLASIDELPLDMAVIDFEGAEFVPPRATLERLSNLVDLRVTVPVRADGFDPFGDDSSFARLPDGIDHVLVAGNPAYLTRGERDRSIAPRLGAALDLASDPWVGTENIERVALATGAGQFELLGPTTDRDLRALRAAGFEGPLAVYAPTVFTRTDDAILDAVGTYLARREPVRRRLPTDPRTDRRAFGRTRDVLLDAVSDYVIAGGPDAVRDRVAALSAAGADAVVAYPAQGLDTVWGRS